MKTFSINTLGCKVNQYESQQVRELLEQRGLRMSESSGRTDLVVINTCCVTHTAAAKSRQSIRKARKQNPDAVVVVSGCLPVIQAGELNLHGQSQPDGIRVIGNRADLSVTLAHLTGPITAPAVSRRAQTSPVNPIKPQNGDKIKHKKELYSQQALPILTSFQGQTRAFLKVQDGCDGYCTYCIVPKARPFVHSKPVEQVLAEAQILAEAGHKEIVVTGIFLGAYGQDTVSRRNWPGGQNDKLAGLLDKMAKLPNIGRIRLSSLEPADVTVKLLDTFCAHPNIMPHLHLALQSGSDSVLKRMCRQYTVDRFCRTVDLVKSRLDRPAITTDIIVGFPGETDADFERTVEIARKVGFAKIHVFAYSPRAGTAAAGMPNRIGSKRIKERSQILQSVGIELGREYRNQFLGQTAQVLLESDNAVPSGRSERYFSVAISAAPRDLKKNQIVQVKLLQNLDDGMAGCAIIGSAVFV